MRQTTLFMLGNEEDRMADSQLPDLIVLPDIFHCQLFLQFGDCFELLQNSVLANDSRPEMAF